MALSDPVLPAQDAGLVDEHGNPIKSSAVNSLPMVASEIVTHGPIIPRQANIGIKFCYATICFGVLFVTSLALWSKVDTLKQVVGIVRAYGYYSLAIPAVGGLFAMLASPRPFKQLIRHVHHALVYFAAGFIVVGGGTITVEITRTLLTERNAAVERAAIDEKQLNGLYSQRSYEHQFASTQLLLSFMQLVGPAGCRIIVTPPEDVSVSSRWFAAQAGDAFGCRRAQPVSVGDNYSLPRLDKGYVVLHLNKSDTAHVLWINAFLGKIFSNSAVLNDLPDDPVHTLWLQTNTETFR